jgi:MurNAc alpha-1-phosphate uridylyltransferase
MRPLTDATPKCLLPVAGRPLLAHVLDRLRAVGVRRIFVNAHHLAEQVEAFCAGFGDVAVLREAALLETGGAVAALRAQKLLPDAPVYVVNGDAYWLDGPSDALARLAAAYDPAAMSAILLLARVAGTVAQTGRGDFLWPRDGGLRRRGERDVAPYAFAGVQIVSPALFAGESVRKFSMNALWDKAIEAGRLGAIVHDGIWFHLSTPDDLACAEAVLAAREVGNST